MDRYWADGSQGDFLRSVGLADGVSAAGRYLSISGQVGQAPDGTIAEGLRDQAFQAMTNIKALVEQAGGSMSEIVNLNCLLSQSTTDQKRNWWGILTDVLAEFMPGTQPACTGYWVSELSSKRHLVELQATAILGANDAAR